MELAKGGEVFDRLLEYGSLPEPEAAKLLYQVSVGRYAALPGMNRYRYREISGSTRYV
jgi:hypothetical protein